MTKSSAGQLVGLLFALSAALAALVAALVVLQVAVLLLSWRRNQHLMFESLQVEAKSESSTNEFPSSRARATTSWRSMVCIASFRPRPCRLTGIPLPGPRFLDPSWLEHAGPRFLGTSCLERQVHRPATA